MTSPEHPRGRYVDRDLGLLEGEGAGQRIDPGAEPSAEPVWGRALSEDRSRTYYERPVLKEPVWIWAVPSYFHVGGAAGAASVLGAAAQAGGREQLSGLIRNCRRMALASLVAGTGFLIMDLGRPARFLNMLRVFRPTSPMSVGSWVLAGSVPVATVSALTADVDGPLRRRIDLFRCQEDHRSQGCSAGRVDGEGNGCGALVVRKVDDHVDVVVHGPHADLGDLGLGVLVVQVTVHLDRPV